MFITRIKRGVVRASLLAQHSLMHHSPKIKDSILKPIRLITLSTLVVRIALLPVPLVAPATAVAAGLDDSDPSPRVVRVSVAATEALHLTRTEDLTLVTDSPALLPIAVGQSNADAQIAADAAAAAEAARLAAEQAAAAEAARIAAANSVSASIMAKAATSYDIATVQQIIRNAAAKYGVSADLMLRIAMCESGFNPASKNAHSAASGLFQFMPTTYANSPAGRAGLSIWDAQANAEAAAFKISAGGLNAWDASKHCWNR